MDYIQETFILKFTDWGSRIWTGQGTVKLVSDMEHKWESNGEYCEEVYVRQTVALTISNA